MTIGSRLAIVAARRIDEGMLVTSGVVAYLRISSDREGRELGVQRQREDCKRLADGLGLTDVEFIVENDVGASTRSRKKRPKFEELMTRVEAGEVSTILAYSNSRLTRRPHEFERLISAYERYGAVVRTVASGSADLSTADGRAVARTLAAWDAAEAERIAERVSRASRQRAEQGEYHGGPVPPFGYRRTAHPVTGKTVLEVDEERAPLVREAASRLLAGDTLYAICSDWNERGLVTSRGAHWRSITLRTALLSPAMVGKTTAGTLAWTPLLPEDDWERLGRLLRDPSRKFKAADGRYAGKRTMGGGLSVCALCGKKLVSQKYGEVVRLICHKQATGGCGKVTINHEALETFVTEMAFAALDSVELRAALGAPSDDDRAEETDLRRRVQSLSEEATRAYEAFVKGWVPEESFLQEKDRIDRERESVEKRLTELATGGILGSLDEVRDGWESRPPLARRAVLSAIIREVRVGPHPAGIATTLTSRRGETAASLAERRAEHTREVMKRRVDVMWRA